MKETEDKLAILRSWIRRINIVKTFMLHKGIYTFSTILEFQYICHRNRKNNPQMCMEPQKTPNSQSNTEQEKQSWMHPTSWFEAICYKARVVRTVCYGHKNRHPEQWNAIRSPAINPRIYGSQPSDTAPRTCSWGKDSLFNQWRWENWIPTWRKMKLCPYLTQLTTINSKMDQRLKCKTWNYRTPRRKHGKKLLVMGLGNDFFVCFLIWHQKHRQQSKDK